MIRVADNKRTLQFFPSRVPSWTDGGDLYARR